MGTAASATAKSKAQTILENIALKADLDDLDATINNLFFVKAPDLKTVITPNELKSLISAVKQGTADNEELTRFIGIAGKILRAL